MVPSWLTPLPIPECCDGTIRLWATQLPELPNNTIHLSTFRDIIKYGHIDDFVHGLKAIDDAKIYALGKKVPSPCTIHRLFVNFTHS